VLRVAHLNWRRLLPALPLLVPVLATGDRTSAPLLSEPDQAIRQAVQEGSRRALERARSLTRPALAVPALDPLAEQAARDAADAAKARGVAALQRMRKERALEQVGDPLPSDGTVASPDAEVGADEVTGLVVLAVSSSMPRNMLADYMAQLDGKPDGVMVLRGFVGGAQRVKPTGQFIEQVSRLHPTDRDGGHYAVKVIVDPLLFRMLGIDRVPAVVYLDGVAAISHCDAEDYAASVVVYGAARISAALEQARARGAPVPDRVLANYKPRGWETM